MVEVNGFGRYSTLCLAFIAIAVIVIIALQGATLHLYRTDDGTCTNGGSASLQLSDEDFLRQRHPKRFLHNVEAMDLAVAYVNDTAAVLNTTFQEFPKLQYDVDGNAFYSLYEIHTCCCIIKPSLRPFPSSAVDIQGLKRKIPQFEGHKQYYFTESCTKNEVSGCKCTEVPSYTSGVYTVNQTQRLYGVAFFKLGKFCKSLNV